MGWPIWVPPNRKRPRGGWQAIYRDENGRQRSAGVYPHNQKRRAQKAADDAEAAIRRGDWIDPDGPRTLVRDWAKLWLSERRRVRDNTTENTKNSLEHHILPEFGSVQLGRVRRGRVQKWVEAMAHRGIPRDSIRTYLSLFSTLMNAAVEEELTFRNPCKGVAIPEWANEGREPIALSADKAGALLAAMPAREQLVVLYTLGTGGRWGEVAGALKAHLDLEAGKVTIPDQLTEVVGRRKRGPVKTAAGDRVVPLPATLAEALRDHVRSVAHPEGYLFTTVSGKTLSRNNWRARVWADAVSDSGLFPDPADWVSPSDPDKTVIPLHFHDLRRTYSTVLENNGIPRHAVRILMGHASDGSVTDRYVLLAEEMWKQAGEVAETFLAKVLEAEKGAAVAVAERRAKRLEAEREEAKRRRAERKAEKAAADGGQKRTRRRKTV